MRKFDHFGGPRKRKMKKQPTNQWTRMGYILLGVTLSSTIFLFANCLNRDQKKNAGDLSKDVGGGVLNFPHPIAKVIGAVLLATGVVLQIDCLLADGEVDRKEIRFTPPIAMKPGQTLIIVDSRGIQFTVEAKEPPAAAPVVTPQRKMREKAMEELKLVKKDHSPSQSQNAFSSQELRLTKKLEEVESRLEKLRQQQDDLDRHHGKMEKSRTANEKKNRPV